MYVKEVMAENIAICPAGTTVKKCAGLMVENDCGEIPVVEAEGEKKLIGVITDRDITCRVVVKGINPNEAKVENYMTKNVYTVKKDDNLEHCERLMNEHQVRRIPVVDENMHCIGIVSHSHITHHESEQKVGELEKNISQPHLDDKKLTQNIENM